MIWLTLLARFWWAPTIAVLIGLLWFQGAKVTNVRKQRDEWQATALQYRQNAADWQASFHQSERMRQDEQGASVGAINASEASCEARVQKARSSAVKIERLVTNVPVCKPGEAIPRTLVDPRALADSLR